MSWHDYFTVEEFRAFVGVKDGHKWSDVAILNAQEEVIEHLEDWARTAWPYVALRTAGDMALSSSTLITAIADVITADDVGESIRVAGAGASGTDLETTVASITDSTHVVLGTAALTAVTGASVYVSGDGTAASARSRTDYFDGGVDRWFLPVAPILSIASITFDSEAIAPESYVLYNREGTIAFDVPLPERLIRGLKLGLVTYSYGYTSTPRSVKRPAMAATRSLIRGDGDAAQKIPPNVTQYTTENTTFVMRNDGETYDDLWPWDQDASRALAAYWERHRPRRFVAV